MHLLLIILLCVLADASYAATDMPLAHLPGNNGNAPTSKHLTLQQVIINVLERSPMLTAAGYEAKAAAARIRAAKLSPAYRGSLELENFAGNGAYSGSDALETTLSLSRVLELGDKAKLRGDLSHNKALLLRNEQDSTRLDLLAETAKRFIDVIVEQQHLVYDNDAISIARHTMQVVDNRVKVGKSPAAELRRASIALSRAELKLQQTKRKLDSSRLKLVTLWGDTKVSFSTADADLFNIAPLAPFASMVDLLDHNPDLVRFATEKRLARSRSLLARSSARSDIEISGGVRHFNETDDTALVFSLNVPFASSSRASSTVEESDMLSLRDPHLYQQQKLKLYATLYELHQQADQAIVNLTTLQETIIPQAEQALQDYEKAYAAGRYSLLELTEAQQLLVDLKLETVIAASDYHRYVIEIDRLTGAGLFTGQSAGVTP